MKTYLIFCYRIFGIRQRHLMLGDEINGYDIADNDYLLGYEPPRYPMPATFGDCLVNHTQWQVLQRLRYWRE